MNDHTPPQIDEKTAKIINYVFKRLKGIIPALKYSADSQVGIDHIRAEYTYCFIRNNINNLNIINKALNKLADKKSTFLPSPGEFIALCKLDPIDIGAPSLNAAYKEACEKAHPCYGEKKWSHEAVKHAYLKTGPCSLRTEPASKTKPAFETAYLESCEDYADGKNLNQIEAKGKDTQENRMAYQEYWGELNQQRKYSKTPDDIVILTYQQWLDLKC